MGATEFRILVAAWALFAAWMGPGIVTGRIFSHIGLDVVIGVLSACTFFGFVWIVRNDLSRLQREERAALKTKPAERPDLSEPDLTEQIAR